MTSNGLPQVCNRCGQLKPIECGQFHWSRVKYHKRLWTCRECADRPRVKRLCRKHDETPIETEARLAIEETAEEAYAEYGLANFVFDFALPRLRLLIEIDSKTYHSAAWRKKRDANKTAWATQNGWHLARLRSPDLRQQVLHAISVRKATLGMK